MSAILGINAFHADSAAALVVGGRLVAAAEEERFTRTKHWAGFPAEAIRYCLAEGGLGLSDVAAIALNSDPRANRGKKLLALLRYRPTLGMVLGRVRSRGERASVQELLARAFPGAHFRGEIVPVEHHRAHLASAFLASPFEDAVVASVDGFGDFASACWGHGTGDEIAIHQHVWFPHSLGIFYQTLTQYLGFPSYGDEYKVMGLAPYGEPAFLGAMHEIVRVQRDGTFRLDLRYFRHHKEGVGFRTENGAPRFATFFTPELERLLGKARRNEDPLEQRHKDIARSAQAMYEEAFFALLRAAHARHPSECIALAGGCAMNSVANGRLYDHTPFRRVWVQAAAGDAGGAIGAALAAAAERPGYARSPMAHAYWGPAARAEDIEGLLAKERARLDAAGCTVARLDEKRLVAECAQALADGAVLGWFQGRMEWGPRALGARSILGDPRRADMKELLNEKIKRRESFRPFAPSILAAHVPEWFERSDDVPFMMQVFMVRADKRALVPAITHVDGSGRLQTVHRETNRRYHLLIERFLALTGVPLVLNTSFNENEPIVCRPEEALDCFLRTKMDLLALGDFLVSRA